MIVLLTMSPHTSYFDPNRPCKWPLEDQRDFARAERRDLEAREQLQEALDSMHLVERALHPVIASRLQHGIAHRDSDIRGRRENFGNFPQLIDDLNTED